MPPATLASMARLVPASMARSQISGAAQGHQFLIGGDHGFAGGDGGVDDLGGDGGAADQFGHDIEARMFDQPPPVGGFENGPQRFGNCLGVDQQVADGSDPQMKPELESDLIGVLRQNFQSARTDVAQTDYPYVHVAHKRAS